HDLIHQMYFRNRPWANSLMLTLGWIARASTINPFLRRQMHLHHHKVSGTVSDLEERGITNGERWGIRRVVAMADNMLGVVIRTRNMRSAVHHYARAQKPANRRAYARIVGQQMLAFMPLGQIYY